MNLMTTTHSALTSTLLASAYQDNVTQFIQTHVGPDANVIQTLRHADQFLTRIAPEQPAVQAMFRFHEATAGEMAWGEIPEPVREAVLLDFDVDPAARIQMFFDAVLEAMAMGMAEVIPLHEAPTPRLDDATAAMYEIVQETLNALAYEEYDRILISHGRPGLGNAKSLEQVRRNHDQTFADIEASWTDKIADYPEYQLEIRQLQRVLYNYREFRYGYSTRYFKVLKAAVAWELLGRVDDDPLTLPRLFMALLLDRLHVDGERKTLEAFIAEVNERFQELLAASGARTDRDLTIPLLVRRVLNGQLKLAARPYEEPER